MSLLEELDYYLKEALEVDWGTRFALMSPDGVLYEFMDDAPTEHLKGGFFKESVEEDIHTGMTSIVKNPTLSIRLKALTRVPVSDERWMIRVYDSETTFVSYVLSRPPEGSDTIGYINLRLGAVEQI